VDAIEPSHTSADAGMIERESTEPSHTLKLPWSFSLWSQATISSQPSLGDARELSLSSSTGSERFWLLGVGLGCGAAATVMMKVGDMERRYWLRIPPLESMVAPPGLQASSRRQ
jgi:hypothetical protein